uniref:Secreted protein n=1 Tax=Syphacia muris TaxID=451379 RepID=A0A158R430_9BILA
MQNLLLLTLFLRWIDGWMNGWDDNQYNGASICLLTLSASDAAAVSGATAVIRNRILECRIVCDIQKILIVYVCRCCCSAADDDGGAKKSAVRRGRQPTSVWSPRLDAGNDGLLVRLAAMGSNVFLMFVYLICMFVCLFQVSSGPVRRYDGKNTSYVPDDKNQLLFVVDRSDS